MGYTTAFFSLENAAGPGEPEFQGYWERLIQTFFVLLGNSDFDGFPGNMRPGFREYTQFLLLTHVLFVTIMLLNLLIAMMSDTFNKVKENALFEWHMTYAQIIFSIESELPPSYFREPAKSGFSAYWTMVGNERFLQVQEVSKEWYTKVSSEGSEKDVESLIAQFDVDGDGVLTRTEIVTGLAKLKAQGIDINVDATATGELVPSSQLGPKDQLANRVPDSISRSSN